MLHALVPAFARATGMPYRQFLVANMSGGTLGAVTVVVLGFTAGAASAQVEGWVGVISIAAATVGAVWVGLEWARSRKPRSERLALPAVQPEAIPELAQAGLR